MSRTQLRLGSHYASIQAAASGAVLQGTSALAARYMCVREDSQPVARLSGN